MNTVEEEKRDRTPKSTQGGKEDGRKCTDCNHDSECEWNEFSHETERDSRMD